VGKTERFLRPQRFSGKETWAVGDRGSGSKVSEKSPSVASGRSGRRGTQKKKTNKKKTKKKKTKKTNNKTKKKKKKRNPPKKTGRGLSLGGEGKKTSQGQELAARRGETHGEVSGRRELQRTEKRESLIALEIEGQAGRTNSMKYFRGRDNRKKCPTR